MLKSLFIVVIIVERSGNKTCDVTVGELKKCGKFETVLVSRSL